MMAFDNAHKAGASGFETDLRLSSDDEIVLSHDRNLARFGHPEIQIEEHTAEELSACTISSIDGRLNDHLISLRSLLEKYPEKEYIFDCKVSDRDLFEILRELLAALKFGNQLWFLTWSEKADGYVREFFPGCAYFPRQFRTRVWGWSSLFNLGKVFEPKNRVLALPAFYLNQPLFSKTQIDSIHERGKTFVGYLVNTEKEYQRCRACGVRTVLSDRPDVIARFEQNG